MVAQVDEGEVLAVLARRATQPHRRTVLPDVGRAQDAAEMRAHGGGPVRLVVWGRGHGVSVSVVVGVTQMGVEVPVDVVVRPLGERGVGEEALELVHNGRPGHGPLLLLAAQGAQHHRSFGDLLPSDDQRHQRTGAVGRLDL